MSFVELDSPRWAEFSDAYGSAIGVPALLKKLRTARPSKRHDSEPWFSLWSGLCHQDTVYTASYAALPHLVEIALNAEPRSRLEILFLVACIELGRARDTAPAMPADLEAPYVEALVGAGRAISALLASDAMGEADYRTLLAASAAVHGYHALGDAMLAMDLEVECPHCGSTFLPEYGV